MVFSNVVSLGSFLHFLHQEASMDECVGDLQGKALTLCLQVHVWNLVTMLASKVHFFFSDNWVPPLIYKVCAICLGRALAAVRRDLVHMGKPELQQGWSSSSINRSVMVKYDPLHEHTSKLLAWPPKCPFTSGFLCLIARKNNILSSQTKE